MEGNTILLDKCLLYQIIYYIKISTVFPQIRPAGIIFLQPLQLRVLLERGYYSRAGIITKIS